MKSLLVAAALASSALALSSPSPAMELDYEVSCLKQDELRRYLGRAFSEARIAEGALENGHRMEIFAAPDGSWTMVELPGDGYACIHSYGRGLQVKGSNGGRPAS